MVHSYFAFWNLLEYFSKYFQSADINFLMDQLIDIIDRSLERKKREKRGEERMEKGDRK